MTAHNSEIWNIDLASVKPSKFIRTEDFERAIDSLHEIQLLLSKMGQSLKADSYSPRILRDKYEAYANQFRKFLEQLEEEDESKSNSDIIREKEAALKNISDYHERTFNKGMSNYNEILETLALSAPFGSLEEEDVKKVKLDINTTLNDVLSRKTEIEGILKETRNKLKESSVSDYAIVFSLEANKNRIRANSWLGISLLAVIILVATVAQFVENNTLPTEIINEETGELIRYSISNAVLKVLIFSLEIFFVTFSTRQYGIFKHQQVLNSHRQNSLNSYKLFADSISKDDETSRNALMVQIAKSIYENNQSTGFLNDKEQRGGSPGIVELTKIIGKSPQ